jgi:hypothetical protein
MPVKPNISEVVADHEPRSLDNLNPDILIDQAVTDDHPRRLATNEELARSIPPFSAMVPLTTVVERDGLTGMLSDEVRAWLYRQMPRDHWSWAIAEMIPNRATFVFRTAEEALLFRLRWG